MDKGDGFTKVLLIKYLPTEPKDPKKKDKIGSST